MGVAQVKAGFFQPMRKRKVEKSYATRTIVVGRRRGAMRVRENQVFMGAPKIGEGARAGLVIGSEAVGERVTDWVRLMKQKVADAMQPGDHGSTFAGRGPLNCVGGVARLRSRAGTWIFRQRENERRIFKG